MHHVWGRSTLLLLLDSVPSGSLAPKLVPFVYVWDNQVNQMYIQVAFKCAFYILCR